MLSIEQCKLKPTSLMNWRNIINIKRKNKSGLDVSNLAVEYSVFVYTG